MFYPARKFSAGLLVSLLLAAALRITAKPLDRLNATAPAPADQPVPIIDFFRPSYFADAKLNPAGTLIAALQPDKNDSSNLVVYDLATRKLTGTGGGEDLDIYDFEWLNDRRVLFRLGFDKLYALGLFATDANDLKRVATLYHHDIAIPIGIPRNDPLKPIVWIRYEARIQGDGGVVQIDSMRSLDKTGAGWVVLKSFPPLQGGEPVSYFSDAKGELAYAITMKDGIGTLHRLSPKGWQPCPVNLDKIGIVGPGDKPDELIALTSDESAPNRPSVLRRLDSVTGEAGEVLHRDETYDPYPISFYRSPADGHILGFSFNRKGPETVWLDPVYAAMQAELDRSLPNTVVRIMGSDLAENKFLLRVSSDRLPARYFFCQRSPAQLTALIDTTPWIDPSRLSPMQLMAYKSRDGVRIEGYYTAPAGPSASPPPLVVLPHGGPWVRDLWGWNPEVQFLASRGYAVFQPNYRGSSGSEWRFPETDAWAFRKMHNDVTDGVRALIKAGLADPGRIAIMGTSFGGYLALCGAAYEGSLYRCAVSVAGVFDWERVLSTTRNNQVSSAQYGVLRRNLGDPEEQKAHFEEISPLRAADKIAIPIFVAHGGEDRVAAIDQSKRLVHALEKGGIPHEIMFESGEGHGFHHLENRVELYTRIEAFLARNLAPRAATGAGAVPTRP